MPSHGMCPQVTHCMCSGRLPYGHLLDTPCPFTPCSAWLHQGLGAATVQKQSQRTVNRANMLQWHRDHMDNIPMGSKVKGRQWVRFPPSRGTRMCLRQTDAHMSACEWIRTQGPWTFPRHANCGCQPPGIAPAVTHIAVSPQEANPDGIW